MSYADSGKLTISGYVTEKAAPVIRYTSAKVYKLSSEPIPVTSTQTQLENIVALLETAGIQPQVHAAGATYVDYQAKFDCSRKTECNVSQAVMIELGRLIGRCSFDPLTSIANGGAFATGNAVANFYRVNDRGDYQILVAHGISPVSGFISDLKDNLSGSSVDQGLSWNQYPVMLSSHKVPFQLSWIDDEARVSEPANPTFSEIGYDSKIKEIRTYPAVGSYLQNSIVGRPNAYPACMFWESI